MVRGVAEEFRFSAMFQVVRFFTSPCTNWYRASFRMTPVLILHLPDRWPCLETAYPMIIRGRVARLAAGGPQLAVGLLRRLMAGLNALPYDFRETSLHIEAGIHPASPLPGLALDYMIQLNGRAKCPAL